MPDYLEGHIKRDPVTGYVALRTVFPFEDGMNSQTWLIGTPNRGASFGRPSDVEDWDDLYAPGS